MLNVHGHFHGLRLCALACQRDHHRGPAHRSASGLARSGDDGACAGLDHLYGSIAQGVLVFWALYRAGLSLRLVRPRWTGPVRRFFSLALPGVVAAGVRRRWLVGLVVASPEPGAVTWLYYADRSLNCRSASLHAHSAMPCLPNYREPGTRATPRPSETRSAAPVNSQSSSACQQVLALVILARPIVSVLFEPGASTRRRAATALALAGFAAGLPAFVGAKRQQLFFARTQMRLPFVIALSGRVPATSCFRSLCSPSGTRSAFAVPAAISGWIDLALLGIAAWHMGLLQLDAAALRRLPRLFVAALVIADVQMLNMQAWMEPDHHTLQRVIMLGLLWGRDLPISRRRAPWQYSNQKAGAVRGT